MIKFLPHALAAVCILFSFFVCFRAWRFAGAFALSPLLSLAIFGLGWWDVDASTSAASYHLPPISGLLAMYFVSQGFPILFSVSNAYVAYYAADFMAMLDFAAVEGVHWTQAVFGIGNSFDLPDALYVMTFFCLFGCWLMSCRLIKNGHSPQHLW